VNLVFTRRALAELAEIQEFIAQDNPRAAAAELDRVDRAIQQLAAGELSGPEVTFRNGQRARRWPVPPYRIYYRRTRNRTTILRVYHGAQRPIER
jgi:plasmid stabilization system protein ParE